LWWPLQYLDFVVLKSFCHNFGSMLMVIGRPICDQALISWDVASIYPCNFPFSWCHLFCEVHLSLLQQSTPTTWCCHPVLHGRDVVLRLASIPLFPPNITMVIMAKQFYLCFIRPEDISPKGTMVLCCCSGIDLHFSHQNTFISRRQNASPSWAVWRLRGPMVFILAYSCSYRGTWYLQASGHFSQRWTRLVEVYNIFSEVLADFPMMLSKEALS
jgi:hypothetical protein